MKILLTIFSLIAFSFLSAQEYTSISGGYSTNRSESAFNIKADHFSANDHFMTSVGYQSYLIGNHNILAGAYYQNEGAYIGAIAGFGFYRNDFKMVYGIRSGYFHPISENLLINISHQITFSEKFDFEMDDIERTNPRDQRTINFFDMNIGIAYRIR